ncbi:hypothetical protein CEXT_579301 [Caerostris extrusa]|uniref:Uncharacterized protein n=1 Tax=Caerostris extrusa TaxID=172846 RepID=A0AAV4XD44_CAEEX|nr:hypothetical protein CEXT_579301 [Caerostris extrusa]
MPQSIKAHPLAVPFKECVGKSFNNTLIIMGCSSTSSIRKREGGAEQFSSRMSYFTDNRSTFEAGERRDGGKQCACVCDRGFCCGIWQEALSSKLVDSESHH